MACHEGVLDNGLTNIRMIRAAKKLGRKLVWQRKINLETDTGILMVRESRTTKTGKRALRETHFVVLKEGLIFDTNNMVWDADVYQAAFKVKVLSLLVEKES